MKLKVTTSWDDGHVLDMRLADTLSRYNLVGTFYIARDFLDERMSADQIRDLAQTHEIGAHTLSHPELTSIPLAQAEREIIDSKKWLEDILGQEVRSFCYPKGLFNAEIQAIVKSANYRIARTVEAYHAFVGDNPLAIPTTIQLYPYPLRPMPKLPLHRAWSARLKPLRQAWQHRKSISWVHLRNWESYALAWAQYCAEQNGVWHLWGHSWEVERYQLWQRLDNVLNRLKQIAELIPLKNSQLV